MMTLEQINSYWQTLHFELTEKYYKRHEISKEDFEAQHKIIMDGWQADKVAGGYASPPSDPIAEYGGLTTSAERIAYIAKRLGLIQ